MQSLGKTFQWNKCNPTSAQIVCHKRKRDTYVQTLTWNYILRVCRSTNNVVIINTITRHPPNLMPFHGKTFLWMETKWRQTSNQWVLKPKQLYICLVQKENAILQQKSPAWEQQWNTPPWPKYLQSQWYSFPKQSVSGNHFWTIRAKISIPGTRWDKFQCFWSIYSESVDPHDSILSARCNSIKIPRNRAVPSVSGSSNVLSLLAEFCRLQTKHHTIS